MKKLSHGDLRGKSERELRSLANKLEKSVHQSRKDGKSTHSLETEICYIQRELELRRLYHHRQQQTVQTQVSRLEFETNI